jgi:hypothetical protein
MYKSRQLLNCRLQFPAETVAIPPTSATTAVPPLPDVLEMQNSLLLNNNCGPTVVRVYLVLLPRYIGLIGSGMWCLPLTQRQTDASYVNGVTAAIQSILSETNKRLRRKERMSKRSRGEARRAATFPLPQVERLHADEFQPHWGLFWCPCDAFRISYSQCSGEEAIIDL